MRNLLRQFKSIGNYLVPLLFDFDVYGLCKLCRLMGSIPAFSSNIFSLNIVAVNILDYNKSSRYSNYLRLILQ